jgi:hypothetical protein
MARHRLSLRIRDVTACRLGSGMRKEEIQNVSVTAGPTTRRLPPPAVSARKQLAAVGAEGDDVILGMALRVGKYSACSERSGTLWMSPGVNQVVNAQHEEGSGFVV